MVGRQKSGSRCNHCGGRTSRTICQACICKGCDRLFVLCECETTSQKKQTSKKAKDLSRTSGGYVADISRTSDGQSQKRDTPATLDDRKTSAIVPHRDAETKPKASLRRAVSTHCCSTKNLHAPTRPGVTANGPSGFFYGVAT
jgi:hypothetical protein